MMLAKVYCISKLHVKDILSELLFKVHGAKHYELVLVKPNICGFYPPSITVLRTILSFYTQNAKAVLIGETKSTMYEPMKRFRVLGIDDLARKISSTIKVVDLTNAVIIEVNVPKPRAVKKFPIPKVVLDADILVNLAHAGPHPSTTITAAIKNLFGLIAEKNKFVKYHIRGINGVIADVVKVIKPSINIVEVRDEILVSEDPLVVDVIAATKLRMNPLRIKHFRLVAEDKGVRLESLIEKIKIIKLET